MGRFAAVNDAKASAQGVYVEPGLYAVQLVACKSGEIKHKGNVTFFVVEMKILESNNPTRPVDGTMSWMVTMDKPSSPSNIKRFVMEATGCPENEVKEEALELICGPSNPLAGTKMRIEAIQTMTQANKPFTKVKWSPYEAASSAA